MRLKLLKASLLPKRRVKISTLNEKIMVQRLLRFFDQEMGGLHQAAFFLALTAVVSKLLALLRDHFLASTFGAGKALDVYYASFILPDYLYNFLLFIVSANALIPIFLEKKSNSSEEGKSFLNEVLTVYFVLTFVFVIILFFLIPFLTPLVAPGFSLEEQAQTVAFSRILLLSPLLLGLSNLISSVIQSLKKFFIYSLSPIFYNLGIILGIAVFYKWWGLTGVVLGVVVGAFFHFFIQVPSLISSGFFPRITSKINKFEVKRIIKLSFPRALGLTFSQIILTVITAIASSLGAGSIAVFNLANNLQNIPLTIIGMSYGIVAFPTLTQFYVKNERDKFFEYILTASRHIVFWSFPATVLFIVLRAQIVRTVLGAGAFTWADTRLTAASLALLSLATAAEGLLFLLVRAFYAAGRTKTPLLINFFSSLFTIGGFFVFLWIFRSFEKFQSILNRLLKVGDVAGAEMLVLPLIFSLGIIINTIFLWVYFQKKFDGFKNFAANLKKTIIEVSLASIVMGIFTYIFLAFLSYILDTRTFIGIFMQGFLAGIGGIGAGIAFLKILKNSELEEIIYSLRRKIGKGVSVIAVEPEKLP